MEFLIFLPKRVPSDKNSSSSVVLINTKLEINYYYYYYSVPQVSSIVKLTKENPDRCLLRNSKEN